MLGLRASGLSEREAFERSTLVTDPLSAAGEQRCLSLGVRHGNFPLRGARVDRRQIGRMLWSADTYLWEAGVWLAAATKRVPAGVSARDINPGPRGAYWTFSTALRTVDSSTDFEVDAFLLWRRGECLWTVAFGSSAHDKLAMGGIVMMARDDETLLPSLSQVAIADAFLRSEALVASGTPLPRPVRRAAKKMKASVPEVKTVTLRRARCSEDDELSGSVEYTCRWLVNGHLRNQWYPSEDRHHLIYIAPHIKGPEDAPLREPRATVNVVRR